MITRNVGVVADGATDRLVFLKIAESVFPEGINKIELRRQSIRDAIDRYWDEASRTQCPWLPEKPALALRNAVTQMLIGAFADFNSEAGLLSHDDILLINTDAERHFAISCDEYFNPWAFCLSKLLSAGVELFYHQRIKEGHQRQYLPFIVPIVSFPSTEVVVAAAKGLTGFYGKKASDLKNLLYGTTDLRTLQDEEFRKKALDFINVKSVESIFRCVPESRFFIQSLFLTRETI